MAAEHGAGGLGAKNGRLWKVEVPSRLHNWILAKPRIRPKKRGHFMWKQRFFTCLCNVAQLDYDNDVKWHLFWTDNDD